MLTISQSAFAFAIVSVYLALGLAALRWIIPHLGANAKGLTMGLLLAQIALIGMAHFVQPASRFEAWLWHLDDEYNFFATLSAAQMVLIGGGALLISWKAQTKPAWQRVAFACLGFLVLYFAWDEYHGLRAFFVGWRKLYAALGLLAAAATACLALRSPRRLLKWYLLFLAGMAIGAASAIVMDKLPQGCNDLARFSIEVNGCLNFRPAEEILEALGMWLALAAICGLLPRVDPHPKQVHSRNMLYLGLLSVALYTFPFWFTSLDLRFFSQPADVRYPDDLQLRAHRSRLSADSLDVNLFFSGPSWHAYSGLGFSVQLVDQVSGETLATIDEFFSRRYRWRYSIADLGSNTLQWAQLPIVPEAPSNRALWLVLTLWRDTSGEYTSLDARANDHRQLSRSQIALGEYVLSAPQAKLAPTVPLATFERGITLDSLNMPALAQTGETFEITFSWSSAGGDLEDYIQFLHFGHQDSGEWWVYDQQPLGPRLPTRLWYSGLADAEAWQVPLPRDLKPGRYDVFTGLYQASDQQRLSAQDAGGAPYLDARVPLGSLIVINDG